MPGSTAARGYGAAHQAERARWAVLVAQGIVACVRCMRLIQPGTPWDLDHNSDRTDYLGPSHRRCNRSIGGRNGAYITRAIRRARRRAALPRW
jgi:hypothetical protein